VSDLAFFEGDKELASLEAAIRTLRFDVEIPDDAAGRVAVQMRVFCDATSCFANLNLPRAVK
jgi:hypothetical protein